MEAVATLASGIAHNYNNILNGLLATAEVATSELDEDDPVHDYLIKIQDLGWRANQVTRRLITFTQEETDPSEDTDIGALAHDCCELFRASLPEEAVFNEKVGPDLPIIRADPEQLRQVMMNLFANALQALDEESGAITVEVTKENVSGDFARDHQKLSPAAEFQAIKVVSDDESVGSKAWYGLLSDGPYVRLSVIDNGCGMSAETAGRVFDPFFSTKPVDQGSGLGLSAVYGIVSSHHGGIVVLTREGKGASFHVYLPS